MPTEAHLDGLAAGHGGALNAAGLSPISQSLCVLVLRFLSIVYTTLSFRIKALQRARIFAALKGVGVGVGPVGDPK